MGLSSTGPIVIGCHLQGPLSTNWETKKKNESRAQLFFLSPSPTFVPCLFPSIKLTVNILFPPPLSFPLPLLQGLLSFRLRMSSAASIAFLHLHSPNSLTVHFSFSTHLFCMFILNHTLHIYFRPVSGNKTYKT